MKEGPCECSKIGAKNNRGEYICETCKAIDSKMANQRRINIFKAHGLRSLGRRANPGSYTAIIAGCLCSPDDNHNGIRPRKNYVWIIRTDCPLHGDIPEILKNQP